MSTANIIDSVLLLVDSLLSALGEFVPQAQLADALVKIAQKATAAYEQQIGQPMDPGLLRPIDPIP